MIMLRALMEAIQVPNSMHLLSHVNVRRKLTISAAVKYNQQNICGATYLGWRDMCQRIETIFNRLHM